MSQINVSLTDKPTLEQKATILGVAAIFARMSHEATEEKDSECARACAFATRVMEEMVTGDMPIAVFENPEEALAQFMATRNTEDNTNEQLEELDAQEQPYVLTK